MQVARARVRRLDIIETVLFNNSVELDASMHVVKAISSSDSVMRVREIREKQW